jgi:hypothetical protein
MLTARKKILYLCSTKENSRRGGIYAFHTVRIEFLTFAHDIINAQSSW